MIVWEAWVKPLLQYRQMHTSHLRQVHATQKYEKFDTIPLLTGYRMRLIYLPTESLEHFQCAY